MRKKVFLVFSSLSVAWRSRREDKKRRDFRAGDAWDALGKKKKREKSFPRRGRWGRR